MKRRNENSILAYHFIGKFSPSSLPNAILFRGDVDHDIGRREKLDQRRLQHPIGVRNTIERKIHWENEGKNWERNFTNCSRFGEFSCNYEKVQCWKIDQGNIDFSCDKMWSWCCINHLIWEQQEESLYQSRFLAVIVFKPQVFQL